MSTLKEKIHDLIDGLPENENLEVYYSLLFNFQQQVEGELITKLTKELSVELDLSYNESFYPENLVSHDEFLKHNAKRFTK
ncbi:hypothetical protein EGI22_19910 [Lacihabitans sp. LS3-19]|uniref:hypothetical protein n=1 Tax=Lacihabitans sp. LS3-19 TaxID=2487335 RepID=UPI0020CC5EC5|nr:hypothetical protein [Lacihabitans sp. LS3-19]MCP9770176.1 hypothetical protein [Lacihabitans sp. LS3-19]